MVEGEVEGVVVVVGLLVRMYSSLTHSPMLDLLLIPQQSLQVRHNPHSLPSPFSPPMQNIPSTLNPLGTQIFLTYSSPLLCLSPAHRPI